MSKLPAHRPKGNEYYAPMGGIKLVLAALFGSKKSGSIGQSGRDGQMAAGRLIRGWGGTRCLAFTLCQVLEHGVI